MCCFAVTQMGVPLNFYSMCNAYNASSLSSDTFKGQCFKYNAKQELPTDD